jgi:NADH-quinone oxidoreductase subunit C
MLKEIANYLNQNVQGCEAKAIDEVEVGDGHVWVKAEHIYDVCVALAQENPFDFNVLQVISGVDYPEKDKIEVNYMLASFTRNTDFILKTDLPRGDGQTLPKIQSVCDVWIAANFQERECFDMLGVEFEGHPDHRRILCPDDWEGHPLRKDYVVQEKYRDMVVDPPEKVNSHDHFFYKELLTKHDQKSVSHSWKDEKESKEQTSAES